MSKKVLAALLAVCMVASLLFVPAAAATFTDVDEDHWASGAIERWAGYGVLNGKDAEAGIFDPSAPMTRAEFAKMLVEMLGLTDKADIAFDDVKADAWYAEVVAIAVKAGIINGRTTEKFEPNEPVTFQEAAVMMCRAFGLAKNTSGAEWAKESIEKLTSLGMIGEGADEHLQVGVDCDRAVVAALADAVVKEYVNEDREEPITGEVNGVVLVVKGAKVEIKDATVSAPIVVESAEVTLTGTKAEDVKVSGKDAAIAADEASSVASVTLAGEAPKADIKGEVASVTIAEETTGAVVDAPKADPDTIVNNSTEEATVNGETVEGKPAETPDPENPDDSTPGSVSGNTSPEAPPRDKETGTTGGSAATDNRGDVQDVSGTPGTYVTPSAPADNTGLSATKPGVTLCGETGGADSHTWTNQKTNPTCTADGSITYTCSTCGATKTSAITKLGHTGEANCKVVVTKQPTCSEAGSKNYVCANPGCDHVVKTEEIAKLPHEFTSSTRYKFDATNHWKICKYCTEEQPAEGKTSHTPEYSNKTATKHTAKCVCGYTKTEDHNWTDGVCTDCGYECAHSWGAWGEWEDSETEGKQVRTRVCSLCEKEDTDTRDTPTEEPDTPPTSHTCEHPKGNYTPAGDGKSCSHTCTVSDQGTHSKETDTQTHTSGSECEYCGKTFYAPTEGTGNWTETDPNAVDAGSR